MPLEDLTLFLIKERWGKLKTNDEMAQALGLKDRAAIAWFKEKIRMPEFEKNYTVLLRSSDDNMNSIIAQKTKQYNDLHREKVVEHNRKVAEQSKDIQREISLRAWERLPHIRAALSDMSKEVDKRVLMSHFWTKYPDYAKEYGKMKSIVAEELRNENKK